LPPSLIFSGPDGVGKRRVAVAVAQALNCTNAGPAKAGRHPDSGHPDSGGVRLQADLEYDACGKCAACTRIARGVHGDVLMVVPGDSGAIKIDQARDVIDRAMYRPFEGRRRVTIIAPAVAMAAGAQNAL